MGGRQTDSDEEDEDGSGDHEGSAAGISFGVDIEPGSFLDMVFNIIPGRISEEGDEYDDNDDDTDIAVVLENELSDGGSSIGALSVSLHPIDLAELFVQVQQTIMENTVGMNCTCGEEMMTEERITEATLRIVEENKKRKRADSNGGREKNERKRNNKNRGHFKRRTPKSFK